MKLRFLTTLAFVLTTGATFAQVPYAGNDADDGVTRVKGFVDPYTGNLAFSSVDLVVSGAVGQKGLSWVRNAASRTTQNISLFGLGHNWVHNWQWEMVDAGRDSQGRAVISVREPQGWMHRYTETSPGQWWPAPSVRDRVVSDGNSFRILRLDAGEIHFTRDNSGGYTLNEIVDAEGNVWKLAWQNGLLVQITEPAGRWLKITYSSITVPNAAPGTKPFTVIAQVSASDNRSVVYDYTIPVGADYPVLTKVTYPDGTVANYTYASPGAGRRALLTQTLDPHADPRVRGRTFQYRGEPDSAFGQTLSVSTADGGAVTQSIAADSRHVRSYAVKQDNGATVYRTYNPGGNVAEEIDGLGYAKRYTYDAGGRGFKISATNELGKATQYVNDASGNVRKETASDGSARSWQRDTRGRVLAETNELGQTRTYTRDAQGRVTKVQHPDASTEEVSYNTLGQVQTVKVRSGAVTVVTYDSKGLRTKVTNALGQAVALTYDDQDRLAAVNDPLGNTTNFARDAAGQITRVVHADGTSANVEYNSFGQITKSTDATGVARTYVYDGFGRPTSVFNGVGGETRMEYAPVGSDGASLDKPARVVSPEGRRAAATYDANGRVTARTAAAGTNQAATTRVAYDAAGRQTSVTNARGNTTQLFYDDRDRCTKVMNALNKATTSTYDAAGHKLSQTDAKGNTTKWTYDAMGRVLTTTDANGQVTQFTYNQAGQRVTLTDAKGSTYRFEYDPLGRQTAMVYPGGSRETTTYDQTGNKKTYTNRAGVTQTFTYDNLNREIASEWSDGSQKIVKAYDAAGRMRLEDNGVSKLTYAFDAAGRLLSETQDLSPVVTGGGLDPAPRTVSYGYTADGQCDSLTYPDGSFVKYTYNARGQLQDILGDGVPPPIASYEYDAAGNATLMPRENQTETEFDYDATNQVTEITDRSSTSHRSPLSTLDYTYDEVGNRTSTTAAFNADGKGRDEVTKDTYAYDATYQVTGVNYGARSKGHDDEEDNDHGEHGNSAASTSTSNFNHDATSRVTFSYDAVGNRVQVTEDGQVTRYTANNLNQYTQVGEFKPTYDRNGNLAGMGQWLYTYDALNRLVSASDGQTTARFFYDAKNRCVARSYRAISNSTLNLNLNYYDNWNLIEERDATGQQLARYIHGRQIDKIVLMVNRYGVFYPHCDMLGNVTFLTDVSGKLVERYSYSVEGEVTITDAKGQELARSAVGNRWMYTGREWQAEVGVYDYRNRAYSAQLGRFLQTDPIRFQANDINIYRYVVNGPTNYTDPSGLDPWEIYFGGFTTEQEINISQGGSVLTVGVGVLSAGGYYIAPILLEAYSAATIAIGSLNADLAGLYYFNQTLTATTSAITGALLGFVTPGPTCDTGQFWQSVGSLTSAASSWISNAYDQMQLYMNTRE